MLKIIGLDKLIYRLISLQTQVFLLLGRLGYFFGALLFLETISADRQIGCSWFDTNER